MPIEGVSDIRRMPRQGKIRLGIKVEPAGGNPYPQATDYFVVPDEIKGYIPDRPKRLNIMFPTEDPTKFAQQWLKCYSFSQGLVCKGNGITATRKIDVNTGDIARSTTEYWEFRDEWGCNPEECEQYREKQCRRVMNLLFLMPDVPGMGCWQLDTTSFYSIVNINSCIDLIKALCGRISFIPLVLSLEPKQVSPPGITAKTVHVLSVTSEAKLADLQQLGTKATERVLLPMLDDEEAPDDLYPSKVITQAEEKGAVEEEEETVTVSPDEITEADVPDINTALKLCHQFWGLQPDDVCKEHGYRVPADLYISGIKPFNIFFTIKSMEEEKKGPPPEDEEPLFEEDEEPLFEEEEDITP